MMPVPAMFTCSTSVKDGFRNSLALKNNFPDAFGRHLTWYGWSPLKIQNGLQCVATFIQVLVYPLFQKLPAFKSASFFFLCCGYFALRMTGEKRNVIKDLGSRVLFGENWWRNQVLVTVGLAHSSSSP